MGEAIISRRGGGGKVIKGLIITPSTVNQAIPKGMHDGTGYVKGDANLIPENIRTGVNIFGTVGSNDVINISQDDIPIAPGDNVSFTSLSGDSSRFVETTYRVWNQVRINNFSGRVRVKCYGSVNSYRIYVRLLRNSTVIHEQGGTSTVVEFTKDVDVESGDTFYLEIKGSTAHSGTTCTRLYVMTNVKLPNYTITQNY